MSNPTLDSAQIRDALQFCFQCDDQLKTIAAQKTAALEALHAAGVKGPFNTSRGVLRVAKVAPGRNGGSARVALVSVAPKGVTEVEV